MGNLVRVQHIDVFKILVRKTGFLWWSWELEMYTFRSFDGGNSGYWVQLFAHYNMSKHAAKQMIETCRDAYGNVGDVEVLWET